MTADQHAPKHASSASDLDTRLLLPPPHDPAPEWGQSLSRGAPGIALLHITRARRGAASWEAAHSWVIAATRAPIAMHPSTGLFHGAAAVAFVLAYANRPAYADALAILDAHIIEQTKYRVDAAHQRIDRAELPSLAEYDLISGLTGLGCYLLHRFGHSPALRDVLDYLVRLTKPLRARQLNGSLVPGWWSSHDHTDRPSPALPGGHANLGMAHGIAGPLALLATAQRRGVTVDGQPEAIDRICRWLDDWRQGPPHRAWWPERITIGEHRAHRTCQPGPARPSWCYGTPGLARAQQLAALALDDPHRQQTAENALLNCITDPEQLATFTNVSLCHGWAGLTQVTTRAAADAHTTALIDHVPALKARLTPHATTSLEQPGLLEGSAGVELTRTLEPDNPRTWAWDACLLTAG